jgi:hypothetical protein
LKGDRKCAFIWNNLEDVWIMGSYVILLFYFIIRKVSIVNLGHIVFGLPVIFDVQNAVAKKGFCKPDQWMLTSLKAIRFCKARISG